MAFWVVTPCSLINTFLMNVMLQCSFFYLQERGHSFLLNPGIYIQTAVEQDQILLDSSLQTCMTYTIAECKVNKLLMMDRRTVRNM